MKVYVVEHCFAGHEVWCPVFNREPFSLMISRARAQLSNFRHEPQGSANLRAGERFRIATYARV